MCLLASEAAENSQVTKTTEFIAQQPCRYRGLQHVRGRTNASCKGGTGFAFVKSGSAHTEKSTVCYVTESCCTDLCPD